MTVCRLRLHSVRVPYGASDDQVIRATQALLVRSPRDVTNLKIVRRSIDTRLKPRVFWSLAVEFDADPALIDGLPPNVASIVAAMPETRLTPGGEPLAVRPVIVGAGPAGLFAALTLAQEGYSPLVLDRGREIPSRDADVAALMREGRLDPDSNFLFGEGGAGAYSDGKLTTRTGDPRLRRVLDALVSCGAPEAILIDARPHIGSDLLPGIVTRLRRKIEALGGQFAFGVNVTRLAIGSSGAAEGVVTSDGAIPAGVVILAPGNSARTLFESLLAQGVAVEAKPFQIGVRIEHPQDVIDRAVYGHPRGELPAAEYVFSCPPSPAGRAGIICRGVASFCMCPGGVIVPAVAETGLLSTNGMSRSARDGRFGNAALVVTVEPSELPGGSPLRGVDFQRSLERAAFAVAGDLRAPAQSASAFLAGKLAPPPGDSSYPLGVVGADLRAILPEFLVKALEKALPHFDRKLPGFTKHGTLIAVEARVSCPVRFSRHRDSLESLSTPRLYPAGEGSGYAGGIMSSAIDGMRAAQALVSRYAPLSTRK